LTLPAGTPQALSSVVACRDTECSGDHDFPSARLVFCTLETVDLTWKSAPRNSLYLALRAAASRT
jgi:hypothetical protein